MELACFYKKLSLALVLGNRRKNLLSGTATTSSEVAWSFLLALLVASAFGS